MSSPRLAAGKTVSRPVVPGSPCGPVGASPGPVRQVPVATMVNDWPKSANCPVMAPPEPSG